MLESLRRGVQTWYFKILLLVIIASFAIWGVGDIFRAGPTGGAVMTVGGKEIGTTELSRTFQRLMNRYSRQLGTELSLEQARQFGLVDQAVQSVATGALYQVEAEELGITTAQDFLVQSIHQQPEFRNAQGRYDHNIFQQVMRNQGITEQGYLEQWRRETNRAQILGSLVVGVPANDLLADRLFKWRYERRVAQYVILRSDPAAPVAEPDDAALRKFHEEHADQFTAPAYRKIVFATLTAEDAKNDVTVSDAELQTAYENRLHEFSLPDRRTVQQIVLPDEETAKKALSMLAENRDFVAVAEEIAQQSPDTTNLGDVVADGILGNMEEAVFKLGKGEISAPVEGPFGWYVFKVIDIKPASTRPLEEVKETLRNQIAADEAIDVLYSLSNALEDARGGGQPLEEAAASIGLKAVTVDAVDRNGQGPDGAPIEAIPQGSDIVQHAFDTPVGSESPLLETPDGGYAVLRVDGETPSALRPFEDVRDEVAAAWKAEQRRQAEQKRAETITNRLNEGATLTAIADEFGIGPIADSPAFTRDGTDAGPELSRALVTDLFAARPGGAAYDVSANGYTIAVLKEIKPADPAADKQARDTVAEQLRSDTASDIIVQYAQALRDRYTVEVNQTLVDNLFLQN